MLKLRSYQQDIIEKIRANWLRGIKSQLVQLATGGGKTIIFTWMTTEAVKNGKKVIIFCDRQELLKQAGGKIESFTNLPYYIEAGNRSIPSGYNVFVAMSQTCKRRLEENYFKLLMRQVDLVVIDEAHKEEFSPLFESGLLNDKFVLGFTATPERKGKQRQLGQDYKIMTQGINRTDLIKQGFLVPDKYYSVGEIDMSGVGKNSKGDYLENQMYNRYNSPELYAGVVDNWKKTAPGLCTLVFCVNISHAIKTCIEYNNRGIKAKFLVSPVGKPKQPESLEPAEKTKYELKKEKYDLYQQYFYEYSGEREDVLSEWESGEFPVLVNAGILTTGYDNPAIRCIVLNRATLSRILLLQMIGRGARPDEGKSHFVLLDFGDNCRRLETYYTGEEKWSLIHEYKQGGGDVPMKECKNCGAIIFAGARVCEFCGAIVVEEKEPKEVELQLVNYAGLNMRELGALMSSKKNLGDFEMWEKIALDKGYKKAWVYRQILLRGGMDLLREYGSWKGYHPVWADRFDTKEVVGV